VLPRNPQGPWTGFDEATRDDFVFRLGNLTLLETELNREAANREYADKRAIYERSHLEINKKLARENEEWTPERLGARQRWMADEATAIWRLSQFDGR
jgi:hypothetical protein